jgi:hypothetical protein
MPFFSVIPLRVVALVMDGVTRVISVSLGNAHLLPIGRSDTVDTEMRFSPILKKAPLGEELVGMLEY